MKNLNSIIIEAFKKVCWGVNYNESKAFKKMHQATAAQANSDIINAFSNDPNQKRKFKKIADRLFRKAGIATAKELHRDAAKLQGIKK